LLYLKSWFATQVDGVPVFKSNLTDLQWATVKDVVVILAPFMLAQKYLEGEKYVTISAVPTIINCIRVKLQRQQQSNSNSRYAVQILKVLLESFNAQWGSGVPNTMFDEHLRFGKGQRHKGFRKVHMLAALLDPRYKELKGFGEEDKKKIYKLLFVEVMKVAIERDGVHLQATPVDLLDGVVLAEDRYEDMFVILDTNNVVVDDYDDGGGDDDNDDDIDVGEDCESDQCDEGDNERAENGSDAESDAGEGLRAYVKQQIARYKAVPRLERIVKIAEGKVIHKDPLLWWKRNQSDFPELAELARRVLCVQATSAPCERLFSHAGLTIANDRARLSPANAESFIFLHDAWDAIDALRLEERE
jgi:zinc finger BED domain-containing protein 1 (E3 SUMO-protein ligase ZBED1)